MKMGVCTCNLNVKLKISKQENLDFITVNKYTRKTKDGSMWYDDLIANLGNIDIK